MNKRRGGKKEKKHTFPQNKTLKKKQTQQQ